jgi:hypothetical protein
MTGEEIARKARSTRESFQAKHFSSKVQETGRLIP